MQSPTVRVLVGLAWALVGALWSLVSFKWLSSSVEKIGPGSGGAERSLAQLAVSKFVRLIVLAVLIYFALRMDIIYAIILVFASTLSRWVQVISYNRKLNHPKQKEDQT